MNNDCIRSILLYLETQPYGKPISMQRISKELTQFTYDEILYNAYKLYEGGYLEGNIVPASNTTPTHLAYVCDIKFKGHELLNNMHDEKLFNKIKEKCKNIGCSSLSAISQIAINIISDKLK